ncbi:Chorion class B protein Ld10 [Papilio machaon]|uniref:Chorion class B protein Ld10 n=1 Tax=Papilio machaon TaxID=76193 RepID=A0A0N0PED2_PAPMA|nr:Chorion class B protein Ld10 [Papilio machaon]
MAAYFVLLSCTLAVTIQNVFGACHLRNSYNVGSCGNGLTYNEYPLPVSRPCGVLGSDYEAIVSAADGGGFAIRSYSAVPPNGVSVVSENEYAGILAVIGELPFLGTTYLEGAVPSAGAGAVAYGCGSGDVRILNEDVVGTTGLGFADGITYANVGYNTGVGYNGLGCGCGRLF